MGKLWFHILKAGECEEFGIHIAARQYYDSAEMIPNKGKHKTIDGLLVACKRRVLCIVPLKEAAGMETGG